MNLWDELISEIEPVPGHNGPQGSVAVDLLMPIIERALAAERAATLMACANKARSSKISIPSLDPNEWTTGFNQGCEAAYCEIETLPRDRSALDDAERVSERQAYDRVARHLRAQEKIEGTSRSETNLLSALDEMLAQARREQREKDARIVETAAGCNCAAVDIGVGTLHEPTCGLVRPDDAAAAIRAPAAPARQRGEQED